MVDSQIRTTFAIGVALPIPVFLRAEGLSGGKLLTQPLACVFGDTLHRRLRQSNAAHSLQNTLGRRFETTQRSRQRHQLGHRGSDAS